MNRSLETIAPELVLELTAIYEEIMWLAKRPNVTPSMARGWYTHVVANRLTRHLRLFTGMVSVSAISAGSRTVLEHHARIQTNLTKFVEVQLKKEGANPTDFIRLLLECERVHIVTFEENYKAMQHNGDYKSAGIQLMPWLDIPRERQVKLWNSKLRGKVMNANDFAPSSAPTNSTSPPSVPLT
ncbi:MAG: hypothetical protein ABL901_00690 [Hyphomicrobiaceae bacterium]